MEAINNFLKHRDTPGHGYFSFKTEFAHLNNNVPAKFRAQEYEEDCEYAIPLFFNFSLLSFKDKKEVLKSILAYNVKAYESTGRKASRKISQQKNNLLSFQENTGKYFSIVGYGSWCYDIPKGYVYRGYVLNNGNEDSSRRNNTVYILLTDEEEKTAPKFVSEEFINTRMYTRNTDFYTWQDYEKATGQPRYK